MSPEAYELLKSLDLLRLIRTASPCRNHFREDAPISTISNFLLTVMFSLFEFEFYIAPSYEIVKTTAPAAPSAHLRLSSELARSWDTQAESAEGDVRRDFRSRGLRCV